MPLIVHTYYSNGMVTMTTAVITIMKQHAQFINFCLKSGNDYFTQLDWHEELPSKITPMTLCITRKALSCYWYEPFKRKLVRCNKNSGF